MYLIPLFLLSCQDKISTPNGAGMGGNSLGSLDNEYKERSKEFSSRLDCTSIECYDVFLQEEEEAVFILINEYRASEDLRRLRVHRAMMEVARVHSMNMALGEVPFGHEGFDFRVEEILEYFSHYSYKAAENVGMARGDFAAEEIVDIWLESQGHKENIEGPYTLSGVGSYELDGAVYFTQIFLDIE